MLNILLHHISHGNLISCREGIKSLSFFTSWCGALERMPWVVHTLQLVVKIIQKEASVKRLLERVQLLVRHLRKSSVATEQLLQLSGLKACPTRWSSTYLMITLLIDVKDSLTQVVDGMGWDCLLPSEWQRLTFSLPGSTYST